MNWFCLATRHTSTWRQCGGRKKEKKKQRRRCAEPKRDGAHCCDFWITTMSLSEMAGLWEAFSELGELNRYLWHSQQILAGSSSTKCMLARKLKQKKSQFESIETKASRRRYEYFCLSSLFSSSAKSGPIGTNRRRGFGKWRKRYNSWEEGGSLRLGREFHRIRQRNC